MVLLYKKNAKIPKKWGKFGKNRTFFSQLLLFFSKFFHFFSLKFFQNFSVLLEEFFKFFQKVLENIRDFASFLVQKYHFRGGGLFLAQNTKVSCILLYIGGWGGPEGTRNTKVYTNGHICMYICTMAPSR